ncbi:hypothetical protein E2C01_078341 [Portunus trituberculatus]|uniref:Uncharacterized protein n=1 Tax=Portunus trituberculatus TaxID=210409 RepID=A0A5B7IPZ2_PORTR|nr:hypothetical protein [Portunus trituberculatus]
MSYQLFMSRPLGGPCGGRPGVWSGHEAAPSHQVAARQPGLTITLVSAEPRCLGKEIFRGESPLPVESCGPSLRRLPPNRRH